LAQRQLKAIHQLRHLGRDASDAREDPRRCMAACQREPTSTPPQPTSPCPSVTPVAPPPRLDHSTPPSLSCNASPASSPFTYRPICLLLGLVSLRVVLKLNVAKAARLLRVVVPWHVHVEDLTKLHELGPQRLGRGSHLVVPAHVQADGRTTTAVTHAAATAAAAATHGGGPLRSTPTQTEGRKAQQVAAGGRETEPRRAGDAPHGAPTVTGRCSAAACTGRVRATPNGVSGEQRRCAGAVRPYGADGATGTAGRGR